MKVILLNLFKKTSIQKILKFIVDKFIKKFDKPYDKIIFNIFLILFYSSIYNFISYLDEKSFSEKLNFQNSIYFSSITNFTLGYGDILPVSPIAKFLVISHSFIFWMVAIA